MKKQSIALLITATITSQLITPTTFVFATDNINKAGQVVYTGTVAIFVDGVYQDAGPKSALQVIVPQQYSNDNYLVEIAVKDKDNIEKARFEAPKFN